MKKAALPSASLPVSVGPPQTSLGAVESPNNNDELRTASEPEPAAEHRPISRRHFIEAIGAVAAAVGLGGVRVLDSPSAAEAATQQAATPSQRQRPLHQWTMIFDLRYCNGCKGCTTACQYYHYLPNDVEWIKVYSMVAADGQSYYLPRPCQMCEDPPCQAVCPVGATFRTDEGLVLIDQNVCIGCRTCMAACPYESRYFNSVTVLNVPRQPFPTSPEWPVPQLKDTVGKCVWCAARLPQGMFPECVTACDMGVIYIGDLTTDVAINGQGNVIKISEFLRENDAVHLNEEFGTNPRVWYIPGHGQDWTNTWS